MQTYSLMSTVTPEDAASARERLEKHLSGLNSDDHFLAVEYPVSSRRRDKHQMMARR
jgi:hypothetical protein